MAIASATSVEVRPLTTRIGAVLAGVDLAGPLEDGTVAAIRQALLAHRVVFFRGQHLDAAGQIAFATRLGPLTHAHPTLPASAEEPALFDLDSKAGASANHWHTDVTFVERPPTFSVLRSVIIPEVGGDTLWANTVAGYADLRPDLRTLADSLRAVHTNGNDYGRVDVASGKGELSKERLAHLHSFVSTVYETEHPVVRVHPETRSRSTSCAPCRPMSPVPRTRCAGSGRRATWWCGTTARPSTTPWPTTAGSAARSRGSPRRGSRPWASTGAPAGPSRATPPTTTAPRPPRPDRSGSAGRGGPTGGSARRQQGEARHGGQGHADVGEVDGAAQARGDVGRRGGHQLELQ